jgi:hypothetical protein
MKMEQTECSETLAFKLQTPVNHPYLLAYVDGTDSVPKRWHLNYRRRCITHTYSPMKMEQTECSKTLAFKLQTPVNHTYLLASEDGTDTVFRNVGI